MGMGNSFETITVLQYRLKAAQEELAAFQSGEKYIRMEKQHLTQVRALERRIVKLEAAVAKEHSHAITIRNQWFEIFEQLQKECNRMVAEAVKKADMMEKRAIRAEKQRDTALEKVTSQRRELYKVKTELDDEKQKVQKLTAQINRNYENSSIPSSKSIARKKISNSREKTGRKPGGQPGHRGHCRKKLTPTREICLPAPEEVLHDPDFKKTSKTITKQKIDISVEVHVTEYHADVYYNSKTGERIHAPFPQGVIDDVNYGGNLRAFLFLLNNDCCTSIDKSRRFLSDLTDGKINISKGMINNLCRSFAKKTESQRKEIFCDMLLSPVMHTDCTNARVNGENSYVFVCAVPDGGVLYFARGKKGHDGIKGTVVEDYQGTLVHDHDVTFYKYGTGHQECLAHVLRYLKDSMDNEKDRTWNRQMHSLRQEMIHYRNGLSESEEPDPQTVSEFEERYKTILSIAGDEYDYEPPGKYYRDGYNLYKRMKKYKKDHLLFLHNKNVPATNNEAERLLRKYKRKQAQAVSFRSPSSIDHLCKCMSMLVLMRRKEQTNLFREIAEIFA
jgi:putative transposase